jgi:hypothetical protein
MIFAAEKIIFLSGARRGIALLKSQNELRDMDHFVYVLFSDRSCSRPSLDILFLKFQDMSLFPYRALSADRDLKRLH